MEDSLFNRNPEEADGEDGRFSRRQVLGRAVTGGVVAAFAALWNPGDALAADEPVEGATVVYDVALQGGTLVRNNSEALDLAGKDLRGIGFFFEGDLYPGGTIPAGEGFDPAQVPAIGHWFCRGWFISHPGRPLPHVVTTQEYLIGRISAEQPTPPDQLVSSGIEGGVPLAIRSVIGGTGRYRGARGEVVQQLIGTNITINRVSNLPAANLRFHFKI